MPKIKEATKEMNKIAIMSVASKLFYEYGYNKTSVNDIIRLSKISKGKFYTYFDSKEGLIFEIINTTDATIRSGEADGVLLNQYICYRLKRFFVEENRMRAKYATEFWASTEVTESQKKVLNTRYDGFKKDIEDLILLGQEKGHYRSVPSLDTFVHVLLATIDGIIFLDTVMLQRITDEQIELVVQLFEGYILNAHKEEKNEYCQSKSCSR